MRSIRAWLARLGGLFGKRQRDGELAAELESHVQMHIEDNVRAGMAPEEARRQALIQLGGVDQTKENCRDRRGIPWLESLLQDARFGLRMLRKNPGFTAVAILTLALGIGANAAIFSVVDAVLLNPIPYPQPDRIVSLYVTWPHYPHAGFTYPNFLDVQRQARSLSGIGAWRLDSFTLTGTGAPEELRGKMVTANFFPLLGVQPVLGRTFLPDDDHLGAAPVAILGEGLWKRKFAADPQIVGKSITLSGKDYTVIGVIPSDVHFLRFQESFFDDLFLPLGQWENPLFRDRRFSIGLRAVGRLRPGVGLDQARAELSEIAKDLDAAYPNENSGMGLNAISLKDELIYPTRPALLLLWGAVGLVLLIACANVANLLLVHSAARKQEFAVRAAIGASRSRLLRQLLIESILLAAIGGALGIVLGNWGTGALLRLFPGSLPAVARVGINPRVLIFAIGLCVATGILFGALPAFRTSRTELHDELKEGGRGASGSHHRTQSAFSAAQIGLALVLLVAAGLLIRSLANVWQVDPGFDPEHVLTFNVAFSPGNLADAEKTHAVLQQLDDRLSSVPGVDAVGLNLGDLPLQGDAEVPFWPSEKPKPAQVRSWPSAITYTVSPGYFKAMGISVIRGRDFSSEDGAGGRAVTIVDENLAKGIFPGEDPIGKRIELGAGVQPAEIIGVVRHVKQFGLDADAGAPVHYEMYGPCRGLAGPLLPIAAGLTWVVVRSSAPTSALLEPLRLQIDGLDGGAAVYGVQTMDAIVAESLAGRTFSMVLLAIFAAIALLLAVIGIYGVIAYSVTQRTHEIGIRMALGAQRRDILRIILGQGGAMALAGVGAGLAASLALTRLMSTMLFGVRPSDPLTFAAVVALLLAVAFVACWIPARRAMRVDPMVALRHE